MTATVDTELHRAVGRVEGKLDGVLAMLTNSDGRHEKTEKRVGALERRQAWYSGAAAAVGAIVGILFKQGTAP